MGLVRGLVLAHDLGADAAALGDLEALGRGPRTHRGPVNPGPGTPRRAGRLAKRGAAAGVHKRLKRLLQLSEVLLAKVDLVTLALHAESNGLGVGRSV